MLNNRNHTVIIVEKGDIGIRSILVDRSGVSSMLGNGRDLLKELIHASKHCFMNVM